MMLDLKEKKVYLKKNSSVVLYHSVVLFFKNLSEESRPLFLGAASRMFWTRVTEVGPHTGARYDTLMISMIS